MVRARFAVLAAAAGLGLLSGCASVARMNPFHRHSDSCPCEGSPYDGGAPLGGDGPILGDLTDAPIAPAPLIPPGGVSTVPPGQVPPLGPPPRLFAQPQPAPQTPQ